MPTGYYSQMDKIDSEKALAFLEHIEDHLEDGEIVICKTCGKTIEEIYEEACEAEEVSK